MIKIQVLGKGMIPRGYGLAPRREPFNADLTFISTILSTPGLSIKFLNPVTNRFEDLTNRNVKKIWDKYSNVPYNMEQVSQTNTAPHVPEPRITTPAGTTVTRENPIRTPNVAIQNVVTQNEQLKEVPVKPAQPQVQHQAQPPVQPIKKQQPATPIDHTKSEEKKEDVITAVTTTPEVTETKSESNNDTLKPVNAPENNNNHNNKNKK